MSVNKVIFIGNVGNDPEVQYISDDVPVARFRMATNETYKDRDGNRQTSTEWHNIVIWRGLAKVVENYVKKGSRLYIEGKLTHRQYEKDGQTRYFTEVVAREMRMLDTKDDNNSSSSNSSENRQTSNTQSNQSNQNTQASEPANDAENFEDVDDLPF